MCKADKALIVWSWTPLFFGMFALATNVITGDWAWILLDLAIIACLSLMLYIDYGRGHEENDK